MTYQRYTNTIKQLCCTNQLHYTYSRLIPYSTKTYWRKQHAENKKVFEQSHIAAQTVSNLKSAIRILLDTLPKQKNKKVFWKKHILAITEVINQCDNTVDKVQILSHLNISTQAFAKWTAKPECNFSEYGMCIKKYPRQLREEEKSIIKQYMQNPEFKFLNRSQVYWRMKGNKALFIHIKTFHKYCDFLGLYKTKQKKTNKRKTEGITATRFLEKIHIDITYLGLLNHTTAYILNIVDNHTRALLATEASLTYNSTFVATTLQKLILQYNLNEHHTTIITDGGSENFGDVTTMLKQYPNMMHRVAKKDMPQLNNIVEACHKRLKNNVLPHDFFENINHLQKELPKYHALYNEVPQNHLCGMTPNDAKKGIVFDKQQDQLFSLQTMLVRIVKNKALDCCITKPNS